MAKSAERLQARELRKNGQSVKTISAKIGVSAGTVSVWCRDIELSEKQIEALQSSMCSGSYRGRLKAARLQHDRRLRLEEFSKMEGRRIIGELTRRELLLVGLGLYIGEGSKKGNKVVFSNSDPLVIQFMIRWFREIWCIRKVDISLKIGINAIHIDRKDDIEDYWSSVTGISKEQFQKTTFIKTQLRKVYENHDNHYGTVQIRICKSSVLSREIRGLIYGLYCMAG